WTHGQPTTWPHPHTTTHTPLPTYPFQHKHHWIHAHQSTPEADDSDFWNAVETGDPEVLARILGSDAATLTNALPALTRWRRERHR
ncbi:hypothetical protein, partial [Streptomyces sp. NPDC001758]